MFTSSLHESLSDKNTKQNAMFFSKHLCKKYYILLFTVLQAENKHVTECTASGEIDF